MSNSDLFFLVFAVLGGLALFIFGMNVMTEGLRLTAGANLKALLSKATRNRSTGLGLGTVLGTLVHSSATTVMLVGFINAGLMTLEQSIAPILGANIGTTISMQAVSFKLDAYCFFAIAMGFIMTMALPQPKAKTIGKAIMGFGLLFLGMKTMGEAIKPHRELLAPILSTLHGDTFSGLIIGILITAGLTAVWQSSGATIAMCFALVNAGVFTDIHQVYPLVLGAHIGTCATGLLGSIGANIEARRSAVAHLTFNIQNVILACLAQPLFIWLVEAMSKDVNRQIANLHTSVMVISAALVLPFTRQQAKLVRWLIRSSKPLPEPSYLDDKLMDYPERALAASIQEIQRSARLCKANLAALPPIILMKFDHATVRMVKTNENVIDEVNENLARYLETLTSRHLSRRQTLLIQHLERCMKDTERIGDHIDKLVDISFSRAKFKEAVFDKESLDTLFDLLKKAGIVLDLVIDSLDASQKKFNETAKAILEARDSFAEASYDARDHLSSKVEELHMHPIASVYFSQYISELDRVVRHAKMIALAELQPKFSLKKKRMKRSVGDEPMREYEMPDRIDPDHYLERLQEENA